jgi:hypothetical protein
MAKTSPASGSPGCANIRCGAAGRAGHPPLSCHGWPPVTIDPKASARRFLWVGRAEATVLASPRRYAIASPLIASRLGI